MLMKCFILTDESFNNNLEKSSNINQFGAHSTIKENTHDANNSMTRM